MPEKLPEFSLETDHQLAFHNGLYAVSFKVHVYFVLRKVFWFLRSVAAVSC